MLKRLFLVLPMLCCAVPALADSWDSDQNIGRAMDAALKTYKASGVSGLVDKSRNCYSGLDTRASNKNVGRDVEYCIAYEFSSMMIDNEVSKAMSFPRNENLAFNDVTTRAMYNLERARVVTLPEEFDRYLTPRLTKIADELPRKM